MKNLALKPVRLKTMPNASDMVGVYRSIGAENKQQLFIRQFCNENIVVGLSCIARSNSAKSNMESTVKVDI